MQLLLNYTFATPQTDSSTGGQTLDFGNATVTTGPGTTDLGSLPNAVVLGGAHSARTATAGIGFTSGKFTIRAVVKPTGSVNERQNIVESNDWPFALFLTQGSSASTCTVVASVNTSAYNWRGADSRWSSVQARTGNWVMIDMVYDGDTLALFLNGQLSDVQAFPRGRLADMAGGDLWVGSWVDGRRDRFQGEIAALQVIAGAPEDLEALLDEARSTPAWHISRKRIAVEPKHNLGNETGGVKRVAATGAYTQDYEHGMLMYHDAVGVAFEMHGAIWNQYKSFTRRAELGYLISDEGNSTKPGARKSLFSKGGIYWSGGTGAKVVQDQIWLDYEDMGEAGAIGLPTDEAHTIPGGLEQMFQGARMYWKTGSARAHEVHGAILTRFLATGGVSRWGFPLTDEVDVLAAGGGGAGNAIGRSSEFEGCTFYWSRRTGAFEVHGDIRRKYHAYGGPAAELGFPTSDEADIPEYSGAGRINTFEKGAICWYGSWSSMVVVQPFKIFVGRVATRESEGFLMGQNDLYTYIYATDGSQTYDKRHPNSGDWGGNNSHDLNLTIPNVFSPKAIGTKVTFRFKCRDADPGNDDNLGDYEYVLKAANAWGLRTNNGVFNVSFSKVRSLTWSVKSEVNVAALSEGQKWWGVKNRGTATVSWQKYARAFSNVDSDTEWWDCTDWLDKAFYEAVVKSFAAGGNCFGMSLEGIYASKNRSVFGMPLDQFTNWGTCESEFNIKHCYQIGAQAIWWFLGQFVTGNTHDPKDVFNRTEDRFARGDHPVVCIAQNYNFSGAPHCILPMGWTKTSSEWRMTVCDPNFPATTRALTVNPNNNTFHYNGSSVYSGGEWSGGRFHYMPYGVLDRRPRTPIWDAILLLLAGTIVIFGEDAETVSIEDPSGHDLDAFGPDATAKLKRGEPVEDYFFDYKGFFGEPVVGGLMFRRNVMRATGGITVDGSLSAHMSVGEVGAGTFRAARPLGAALSAATPALRRAVSGRTAHSLLADSALHLTPELTTALTALASANREGSWDHRLKGKTGGALDYTVAQPFLTAQLSTAIRQGEEADLIVRDISSSKQSLGLKTGADKQVDLTYVARLGAGKDRVQVSVKQLPVEANKPFNANIRPGIGGVDLVANAGRAEVDVHVKTIEGAHPIERVYRVPVDGGMRLHVAGALDEGELSVGRIDRLFGRPTAVTRIRPR